MAPDLPIQEEETIFQDQGSFDDFGIKKCAQKQPIRDFLKCVLSMEPKTTGWLGI